LENRAPRIKPKQPDQKDECMTNQTDKPVGKLTPLTYADKIIGVYRKCTCPEGSSAEGSVKITRKPDGTNVATCKFCGATLEWGGPAGQKKE
jgi:hypothetical protein